MGLELDSNSARDSNDWLDSAAAGCAAPALVIMASAALVGTATVMAHAAALAHVLAPGRVLDRLLAVVKAVQVGVAPPRPSRVERAQLVHRPRVVPVLLAAIAGDARAPVLHVLRHRAGAALHVRGRGTVPSRWIRLPP